MKLLSLNVEKRNHLAFVKAFLIKEKPELVALMEVCEADLEELLGDYPDRIYGANFRLKDGGQNVGVVVAARAGLKEGEVWYADGNKSAEVPVEATGVHRPVVVRATLGEVRLAATHFTWTANMSESEKQTADAERLLDRLEGEELVVCGDFNIPRGNRAYQKLAARYRDNIPKEVMTTIDFDLHRAKAAGKPKFEAVVDYVWSTPGYRVSGVRVVNGVSDHCGLVAEVRKILGGVA